MTAALVSKGGQARLRKSAGILVPLGIGGSVAAVVLTVFDKGWLPHDDGYLAWAARETLRGRIPHRDFHEVYTGGLSYLNSWAFRLFGESLLSLRIPYLVFFAVFGVFFYLIARRFLDRTFSAVAVGALSLLGPVLTATPMPTLYNLFLGTVSLYFAIRFVEGGRLVFLVIAGVIIGLSVLVKVTGLYFLLAIPLGLIAHRGGRRPSGPDFVSRGLLILAAVVPTLMIGSDVTFSRFVGLLIPIYIVVWCVWSIRSPSEASEVKSPAVAPIAVLAMTSAVPPAAYVIYQFMNDGLGELVTGISGSASAVVSELGFDLADLWTLGVPLGIAGICVFLTRIARRTSLPFMGVVIGAFVLLWYALAPWSELLMIHVATRWVTLTACLVLISMSVSRSTPGSQPSTNTPLIMLAAVAACFQLVQFPSSNQWHVAYTVPLAGLLLFALLSKLNRHAFVTTTIVIASFAVVFGLARIEGQVFASSETGSQVRFVPLEGDYGRIMIPMVHDYYNDVVAAVNARPESQLLMAGPDHPEIYFLTGRVGSYPGVFPVLDRLIDEEYSMLEEFENHSPDLVVLDPEPSVSDLEVDFVNRLAAKCVLHGEMGRFLVYLECAS